MRRFNRTSRSTFDVTVAVGKDWTQPYTFRIIDTGLWKVQFLPFKDGDISSAYRDIHLCVRVTRRTSRPTIRTSSDD